jgi:ABC-2 type transport system permease protein
VALLVGTAVLAVVAIMSLAGGVARTAEQAANLQSIVAVTAAMLGGTFVPIGDPNSFLGQLSLITPNAWFIRGLGELAGGTVSDALPAAGVLLAMALGFGAAGLLVVRKVVKP